MADLSDVEQAIVNLIAAAIYPTGTSHPSVVTNGVRIRRGWLTAEAFDADLAAGVLNVTVFPQANMTRRTTRYPKRWQRSGAAAQPTLAWTISGETATLTGTVTVPQTAGLIVNGVATVYAVQSTDTLATIVAAIGGALSTTLYDSGGERLTDSGGETFGDNSSPTVSGNSITIPSAYSLIGRVGVFQTVIKEVRRQEQGIQVSCWCPDPVTRDALAVAVDGALSPIEWLTMPDGSAARLLYRSTIAIDKAENNSVYRRDMTYTVEYASTITETVPTVVYLQAAVTGAPLAPAQQTPGTSLTITADT